MRVVVVGVTGNVGTSVLEAMQPRRTRTIEIEQFVELAEVDPIYFEHPYFLVPAGEDDGARRAYRLLVEAMARTGRAALGRFVMRAKEYLAIVSGPRGAARGEAGTTRSWFCLPLSAATGSDRGARPGARRGSGGAPHRARAPGPPARSA
jgi:hypothetical protein